MMIIDGWNRIINVKDVKRYRAVYKDFRRNKYNLGVKTYHMYGNAHHNYIVNTITTSDLIFISFGTHNLEEIEETIDRAVSYGYDVRLPTVKEHEFIIFNEIFYGLDYVWTHELYHNTFRDGLKERELVLIAEGILEVDE